MWLLRDSNEKITYLKPNKTITIGRKQADIVLGNDLSISRAHATITVTLKDQIRTTEVSSTCIIKDAKSKYGTSIIRNGVQLKVPSEGLELQATDTLIFGLQQHIFKVNYIRFVTIISRLSAEHKKKLKEIMDSIGGLIIDSYDDNCTHLTATTATSTNKIISALIDGIPIVDINYWTSVVNSIETNNNLPDPNLFVLPLKDKGVNTERVSLKPKPLRKTLFQQKTFIFFSEKMYKEYKKMIKDAGGEVELYNSNIEEISNHLFADNSIIMQIAGDSTTDDVAEFHARLYDKMQEKKLRMVAESEIPLAIVYVSLDQYCNPKYHFKDLIKRKDLKEDVSEVLALDTQDILISNDVNVNIGKSTSKQVYIPETVSFSQKEDYVCNTNIVDTDVLAVQDLENITKTEENLSRVNLKKNDELLNCELTHTNLNKEETEKANKVIDDSNLLRHPKTSENKVIGNSISLLKSETSENKDIKGVDSLLEISEKNIVIDDSNSILEQYYNSVKSETSEYLAIEDVHPGTKSNLKITIEDVQASEITHKNIDTIDFDKLTNNKQSQAISENLKNVLIEHEDKKSKKRQRDRSIDDDMNKSRQKSDWKSKEKVSPIEVYKKRKSSSSPLYDNYFEELDQTKTQKNKLNKWGFKKSVKKSVEFDLDDLDAEDQKEKVKREEPKLIETMSRIEGFSCSEQGTNFSSKLFNMNNEIDENIENKSSLFSVNDAQFTMEIANDCIDTKSFEIKNSPEQYVDKHESGKSVSIKPNYNNAESNLDVQANQKAFKKVNKEIPVTRIALSQMSVWKPNT